MESYDAALKNVWRGQQTERNIVQETEQDMADIALDIEIDNYDI